MSIEYANLRHSSAIEKRSQPPRRSKGPTFWKWLTTLGIGLFLIVAMGGLVAGIMESDTNWLVRTMLMQGLPILLLLLFASLAILLRNWRQRDAATTLFYVAEGVRLNLPLPPFLQASAKSERGRVSRRLLKLQERLTQGEPLASALRAAEPATPLRTLALIEAGERSGQLSSTLTRIAARTYVERQASDTAGDIYLRWYPMVMLMTIGGGTGMLMVFVVPKFEYIFKDFKLELPPITKTVIGLYRDWGPIVSVMCTAALAVMLAQLAAHTLLPGWGGLGPFRRLAQRLLWWTPLVANAVRARAMADALNVMADALDGGGSLADAALHASRVPSNAVLQMKLKRWSSALTAGTQAAQAAVEAGMPKAVCGMMSLATASARMEKTLRFLARHYEARVNRSIALLRGAAIPMISLFFGGIVLVIILALMTPLIDLTTHISGGFR